MWQWMRGSNSKQSGQTPPAPVAEPDGQPGSLELDGNRLRQSLEGLVAACEPHGGVERLVLVVAAKVTLFQKTFSQRVDVSRAEFLDACTFIATVRRRIGKAIQAHGFERFLDALNQLQAGDTDPATADIRLAAFCSRFPADKQHRWVRDLGAEILHFSDPDHYPLMTRWVWDQRANTGVLREIWFADNVDALRLDVADNYPTHAALSDELCGFLRDNGVYANLPLMLDLLCAYIYGEYIATQGSSFLKTHFAGEDDVLPYALRMLGLDGANKRGEQSRLILPDESRHRLSGTAEQQ